MLLLLFAWISAAWPTVSSPRLVPPVPIRVRGHLQQAPLGDTVWLEYRGHLGRQALHVPLSPTGDFALVASDISAPTHASLYYAGQRASLYLTPGDELHLTLDYPHFRESARYTGRGANANNYLALAYAQFEHLAPGQQREGINSFGFFCESPRQERQKTHAFRRPRQAFLAAYARQHPLPPAFRRAAAAHIELLATRIILTYTADHPRRARTPQQAAVLGADAPGVLPASYFKFLRHLPPGTLAPPSATVDRGFDDTPLVHECLELYAVNLLAGGARSPEPATAAHLYARATRDLGRTTARDYAMTLLFEKQQRIDPAWLLAAEATIRAQHRDSASLQYLRHKISQLRRVQPGRVAPAFTLRDHRGQLVSLSDFQGKVVYLDFWGTWCRPCREELPASRALRQQFAGREVVFVSIAVHDQPARWQQVLADEQLTGPATRHLWAPDNSVVDAYQIHHFPTYLLIGRDGRLLTTQAPAPSTGEAIRTVLEEALH